MLVHFVMDEAWSIKFQHNKVKRNTLVIANYLACIDSCAFYIALTNTNGLPWNHRGRAIPTRAKSQAGWSYVATPHMAVCEPCHCAYNDKILAGLRTSSTLYSQIVNYAMKRHDFCKNKNRILLSDPLMSSETKHYIMLLQLPMKSNNPQHT